MAYAEINSQLLAIAGNDRESVETALDAGAFDIDSAFQSGGYLTPIDLTEIADLTVRTRVTAKLAEVNRAKAAFQLSSGSSRGRKGQSSVIAKDWSACNDWLKKVASRDVIIPGLPMAVDPSGLSGGGVTGFAVAGAASFRQDRVKNAYDIEEAVALGGSVDI
jgi:hypothetical protein